MVLVERLAGWRACCFFLLRFHDITLTYGLDMTARTICCIHSLTFLIWLHSSAQWTLHRIHRVLVSI